MITVSELQALCGGASNVQLVDVRSGPEFAAGHIPCAVNVPLEQVESRVDDLRSDVPVVLICQRGARAAIAAKLLGACRRTTVLEGGTNAWCAAGLPLVRSVKARWALERQVRFATGLIILTGVVLSLLGNPRWVLLSGSVGLGLTFAGLTDFCPLASLVGRMPWNRARDVRGEAATTCSL